MPRGLKEIRRRIRSVEATEKITSAMKLVAASKLRRAEERARAAAPYATALRDVLAAVGSETQGSARLPLLMEREVARTGIVVVTGDRGLCGPYNSLVLRLMEEVRAGGKGDPLIFPVGRRARDYCERRRLPIGQGFAPVGDDPTDAQARAIGESVAKAFIEGTVDEVILVSTKFAGAMSSRPNAEHILPLPKPEQRSQGRHPFEFEPDPETVLSRLLPAYLNSILYGALLGSKASEQGARMVAMDNATRNAKDLVRHLTLTLNRVRQEAITREIAELVGGAEAVK